MAAPSNDAANLVEEFEESFQSCLNVLTKQEAGPCVEKEEVKVEVERFIDLARQMEAFFLQKRFLLSALKPELLVKEDNNDLRVEVARKEELLKKHLDKIAMWQNLLNDLQGYSKCGGQAVATQASAGAPPQQGTTLPPSQQPTPSSMLPMSSTQTPHNSAMQMQQMSMTPPQQMQHPSQLQQMHHHQQQQAIQMGVPGGMFMGQGGPRGAFPPPGSLQGPLAYLEKTTTNIDLVGMGDGRR